MSVSSTLHPTFGAEVITSLATASGDVKGVYLMGQLTGGFVAF